MLSFLWTFLDSEYFSVAIFMLKIFWEGRIESLVLLTNGDNSIFVFIFFLMEIFIFVGQKTRLSKKLISSFSLIYTNSLVFYGVAYEKSSNNLNGHLFLPDRLHFLIIVVMSSVHETKIISINTSQLGFPFFASCGKILEYLCRFSISRHNMS